MSDIDIAMKESIDRLEELSARMRDLCDKAAASNSAEDKRELMLCATCVAKGTLRLAMAMRSVRNHDDEQALVHLRAD